MFYTCNLMWPTPMVRLSGHVFMDFCNNPQVNSVPPPLSDRALIRLFPEITMTNDEHPGERSLTVKIKPWPEVIRWAACPIFILTLKNVTIFLRISSIVRCNMASFEPMNHNKLNIAYLLMPRSHIVLPPVLRSTVCKMWYLKIIRSCSL